MRPHFADLASYHEPDPHKVVICIEQKRRPYPRKCRFARAVAVAKRRIFKSVDERLVPRVPRKRLG